MLHFRAISGTYFRKVVRPLPQTQAMFVCLRQNYDPETPVTAERSNDSPSLSFGSACLCACSRLILARSKALHSHLFTVTHGTVEMKK